MISEYIPCLLLNILRLRAMLRNEFQWTHLHYYYYYRIQEITLDIQTVQTITRQGIGIGYRTQKAPRNILTWQRAAA